MSFTAITDRIFSENRGNHIINRNSIVVFFIPCVYINTHVYQFSKSELDGTPCVNENPSRQMEHVRQYGHRTKTFHGWKICTTPRLNKDPACQFFPLFTVKENEKFRLCFPLYIKWKLTFMSAFFQRIIIP